MRGERRAEGACQELPVYGRKGTEELARWPPGAGELLQVPKPGVA